MTLDLIVLISCISVSISIIIQILLVVFIFMLKKNISSRIIVELQFPEEINVNNKNAPVVTRSTGYQMPLRGEDPVVQEESKSKFEYKSSVDRIPTPNTSNLKLSGDE